MLPSISRGCRGRGVPKNLAVILYACQEKEENQGHFLKRLRSRKKSLPAYNCFKDQIRGKKLDDSVPLSSSGKQGKKTTFQLKALFGNKV